MDKNVDQVSAVECTAAQPRLTKSPKEEEKSLCVFFCIGASISIGREIRCLPYAGFSKHRPSGPMLSISRNVRLSVRLSVCSLLRYRLNVFLLPLPEFECLKFLEIRNPWGKVMERSGLTFEPFCL